MGKQLLTREEELVLDKFIRNIERFVLEEEFWYNFFRCKECDYVWKTELDWYMVSHCDRCKKPDVIMIQEKQTLYDIEMAIESNQDFTSYFEKYGNMITKFDVERRLNKIKEWIFSIIKERSQNRRFKRLI